MPAIYPFCWFPECGGLMSYGGAMGSLYQQVGTYVGRILKGAKPIDLPIEQNTKYEIVVNLKTAKAQPHCAASLARPPAKRSNDRSARSVLGQVRLPAAEAKQKNSVKPETKMP